MSASVPAALDRLRKILKRRLRILLVDADAALDGDRDRHRRLHRRDAIADQMPAPPSGRRRSGRPARGRTGSRH